jgi:hypothetical protein
LAGPWSKGIDRNVEHFDRTLEQYGADPAAICLFETGDRPELLPYATIVSARNGDDPSLSALIGVYEWQNSPLLFLVDEDRLDGSATLSLIRRRIAMRGDAQYLGVLRPGQLTVHRVSLDTDTPDETHIPLDISSPLAKKATLPYLANRRPGAARDPRRWISNVILKLLAKSIEDLKNTFGVEGGNAISVVGRALFTRFLGDRGLLPSSIIGGGQNEAASLFDSAERAENTSNWLDDTFNGDFLHLPGDFFRSLQPDAFKILGNVLRRAPSGQLSLEWEEKWERLDFAHIPVGVLSQAYEHYLLKYAPTRRRKEGGYYTPRIIAETMVRGAFHALNREGASHRARVLDPAAGAGVFLITAFSHLVAERWRFDKVRPDTKVLREILYQQITGFDINEAALRFAALGLYLMSIELDSHPEPIQKQHFDNLRGTVLQKVGEESGEEDSNTLGSLGPQVDPKHLSRYDLIIGNPPWSSGTGLKDWEQVTSCVARIARSRNSDASAPKLPNEVLDLPFVWRAMEWAKPGAQIAFALHARLLFQQGEGMSEARSSLMSALDVTGIVNGSELRQTRLWPDISAPFCILFARNQVPPPGAAFRFVSPHIEKRLHNAGGWRIDADNAAMVSSEEAIRRPEVLKVLFRGSELDLEIYDRVMSRKMRRLDEFWSTEGTALKTRHRYSGNGYQKLRHSSAVKKTGDGKPGESAAYLWDLPEVRPEAIQTILVDASKLTRFSLERVHRGRPRELYLGPKLLVQKSPPAESGRIRVAVTDLDVLFNETYYGYSAKEHRDGSHFVRYLAMLAGSKCALWHALITSGEFGFEREVIEKFVIDSIPVPPFENLAAAEVEQIDLLFDSVAREDSEQNWERVDAWASSLYGISERDLQVITETLRYNLPFSANKNAAQTPPTASEIGVFCTVLASELTPWAKRLGKGDILASSAQLPSELPWEILRIHCGGGIVSPRQHNDWSEIVEVADQHAATEIIYPDPTQQCLWLARLKQARYWGRSQARLVARRIAWEHLHVLF